MERIYQLCFNIFSQKQSQFQLKYLKLSVLLVKNLSTLSLNIHFLVGSGLNISGWDSYSSFWNSISILSLDFLAVKYDFEHEFLILLMSLISSIFIIAFISIVFVKKPFNLPNLIVLFFRLIIEVICEIIFIPSCVILLLVFKYNNSSRKYEEYPSSKTGFFWDFENSNQIISALFLVLMVIFTLCYETCNYDIRFVNVERFSMARGHGKVHFVMKIVYFFQSMLYVTISTEYKELYSLIVTAFYVLVSGLFMYYMPYYSFVMNLLQIFIHLNCACMAGFMWMSLKLNNATILFVFFIIIQPILTYISYELLKYRISLIKPLSQISKFSFDSFELSIRRHLQKGDLKEKLLTKLSKNYSLNKNKLNFIIQAYYAYDVLKNPTLALNKIFYVSHTGYNFFVNFQVYKCRKIFESICEESSETFKYFKYFANFSSTKVADQEFCLAYNNFLNLVCHENFTIDKIKKGLNDLVKKIKQLKKSYTWLIERYPDSDELKDMYASLLLKLLCDNDQNSKVLGKLTRLAMHHSIKIRKTNYYFEKSRCYLVVSGSLNTLGKVLYFDKNFLNFFSYSEEIALTLNLNSLIPFVFTKSHNFSLFSFLNKCTSHIAFQKSPLCMIDSEGFLLEYIVNVECIGFNDSINFVCAIDIIGPRRRELALVSSNGFIYGHSRYFCHLLHIPKKSISDKFLIEFTNLICIEDMIPDKIYKINSELSPLACILKERKIGRTLMQILYISSDAKEINSWNDQSSFFGKDEKIFSIDEENSQFKDASFYKDRTTNLKSDEENSENIFSSKKETNPSYIKTLIPKEELNLSLRALRILKITRILLLISVLSIIVCNLITNMYIGNEVKHSNSLEAIINLNHATYLLTQCAIIIRSFDISFKTGRKAWYSDDEFLFIIEELKKLQVNILDDYDKWSYCKSSKVVKKDVVPYWNIDKSVTVKYANLHKVIEIIISNAEKTYKIMKNSKPYNTTFFNTIYNAYGPALATTKKTIKSIILCENARVDALFSKNIYFILGGLGVLGLSTIFLAVFLIKIDKHLNSIWELLRKKLRLNYPQLKSYLSDRLVNIHNSIIEAESSDMHKNHIQTLKYKHYLRYFLRLLALFFIVGFFYLINSLYFYDTIKNGLYYRPLFVTSLSSRRVTLSEIQFLVTESFLPSDYSLQLELKTFYLNSDPYNRIINIVNEFSKIRKANDIPLQLDLLSKQLHDYIYVGTTSTSTFLSKGTSNALRYLIQESLNIVYNKGCTYDDLEKYIKEVKEYCNFTISIKNLPENNSKEYITEFMDKLTYFVVGFYICLLIIYFGFYFPYFTKEIETIKNVVKMLLKLPNQQ